MRRWRRMMRRGRVLFLRILRADDSSARLALGAAVGVFVAMTPTIGLQMVLVLLILLVIPGNKLAGMPMVWISNPATAVPIYTFNYWLGAKLTGQPLLENIGSQWRSVVEQTPSIGGLFTAPGEWFGEFWHWLSLLWLAMRDILMPLWVGSLLTGIVAGVISYFICYYLIEFYRKKLRLLAELLRRRKLLAASAAAEAAADEPAKSDANDADGPPKEQAANVSPRKQAAPGGEE